MSFSLRLETDLQAEVLILFSEMFKMDLSIFINYYDSINNSHVFILSHNYRETLSLEKRVK